MSPILNNGKPTQDFVPIKEIRDGVVVLKDGSLRMVLIASSLNFALKSQDEQMAILMQYQNFLNSLDFHIQIFIQSRRLDITSYIQILQEKLAIQTNDLLKTQTREYIEFIKEFTEGTNIMTKSFFIAVPYDSSVLTGSKDGGGLLSKIFGRKGGNNEEAYNQFAEQKTQLEQRTSVVQQGLGRIGIRAVPLGTEELVELYFKLFNPGELEMPSLGGAAQNAKK